MSKPVKSVLASAFDVAKIGFGAEMGGSENKPTMVGTDYEGEKPWFVQEDPQEGTLHPVTGSMGTKASNLKINCRFGITTKIHKDGGDEPVDPKVDLVLPADSPTLKAIAALEEKVIDHYVKTNAVKNPKITRQIAQFMFKSSIKPSKKKDEKGNLVEDPSHKVLSLKFRVPASMKSRPVGASDYKERNNFTQFRMAKLDKEGFVMSSNNDEILKIEDCIEDRKFKNHYMSCVIQPSAYWFNKTMLGLKLFIARVRLISPYTGGGSFELPEDTMIIGKTLDAGEAPVEKEETDVAAVREPVEAPDSSDEESDSEDSSDDDN